MPVLLPALLVVGLAAAAVHIHSAGRHAEGGLTDTVAITSDDGAAIHWSRREQTGVQWIDLHDGSFRVQIRSHAPSRSATIHVPDGRIDDLGTTFHVAVSSGRTKRVVVDEGSVALRLRDTPPTILDAGEVWERPAAALVEVEDVPAPTPRLRAIAPAVARAPRRTHTAATEVAGDDVAAEDAAYLNIIRLLRASKRAEARAAGREYLIRFPDGFRRDEMGAIAK